MQEFHYNVQGSTKLLEAYQAQYTYHIPTDQHARSTTYMYPTVTEQFHYNSAANPPAYQALRRTTAEYDNYGCMFQSQEAMWDPLTQMYVPQKSSLGNYTKVSWGGEMLQNETFVDETSGFQKQVLYTLTSDEKLIQYSSVKHQARGDREMQPWKTKSMGYDSNGRITSEAVSWSAGVSVPTGSVSSYTNRNSYRFDPAGFDIVTATDPQGNPTITTYGLKISKGPMVSKQLPLKQVEKFFYDLMGRCTGYIDPFGMKTTKTYTVGAAGNTVTSRSPLGYVTRDVFDILGRKIELLDNSDPTQQILPEPTRVLSRI